MRAEQRYKNILPQAVMMVSFLFRNYLILSFDIFMKDKQLKNEDLLLPLRSEKYISQIQILVLTVWRCFCSHGLAKLHMSSSMFFSFKVYKKQFSSLLLLFLCNAANIDRLSIIKKLFDAAANIVVPVITTIILENISLLSHV